VVCFDLEGPISPQDNAFDVMGLIPRGREIFSAISAYDDELALAGKKGYEPGDTLKLILPFLLAHKIKNADVKRVSDKAVLVSGVKEVVSALKSDGWTVNIISTSYEPHAVNIAKKVGVDRQNVYCTKLDLDEKSQDVDTDSLAQVAGIEAKILALAKNPEKLNDVLDEFYWKNMLKTPLGRLMDDVSVCGGARKVAAAEDAAKKAGTTLSGVIVVGDSITDYKMLERVRSAGGLAVVFNGNKYALPYGNIGLASKTMTPLLEIAKTFSAGGTTAVEKLAKGKSNNSRPFIHWIPDGVSNEITAKHKEMRSYCRGKAAKLG
jgi:energy-converting hydrogenase A subunit R